MCSFYILDFAVNTPEYIHPRKYNELHWLMSPPVVEHHGDVMQCLPVGKEVLRNTDLLRPDDFLSGHAQIDNDSLHEIPSQNHSEFCDSVANLLSDKRECTVADRITDSSVCSHCSDSGFSTPDTQIKSDAKGLEQLYLLCKECSDLSEFNCKLKLMMSEEACDSLLPFLFSASMCKNSPHSCHFCLLIKVGLVVHILLQNYC